MNTRGVDSPNDNDRPLAGDLFRYAVWALWLSFARQCEGPRHGFNIAPHSASSALETQLAGLQILEHFAMRPRRPAEIESYVASCQMATGGFGRAPGATERLDDSLHALQILALLGTHESTSGSPASTITKAQNP